MAADLLSRANRGHREERSSRRPRLLVCLAGLPFLTGALLLAAGGVTGWLWPAVAAHVAYCAWLPGGRFTTARSRRRELAGAAYWLAFGPPAFWWALRAGEMGMRPPAAVIAASAAVVLGAVAISDGVLHVVRAFGSRPPSPPENTTQPENSGAEDNDAP
ncbi:hypothetical protein IL992_38045 [Microbispora sp. NEAU-D428]|uniref:hypothetical protein n=1 Tax=Microbispora sitophila TaxID=2771537 RepID=UPI00186850C9|nr:hypothetical protein [Microbispora sitophila]MBE3014932.1 hypothetical protein [Microbispora sitophila]